MVETCSCGYFFYPLPAGAEYCSYMRHPAWGELPAPPYQPVWPTADLPTAPGSLLIGSPVTVSPGHCFHHLYQKLKTHQLPCTTRCPRPCR